MDWSKATKEETTKMFTTFPDTVGVELVSPYRRITQTTQLGDDDTPTISVGTHLVMVSILHHIVNA